MREEGEAFLGEVGDGCVPEDPLGEDDDGGEGGADVGEGGDEEAEGVDVGAGGVCGGSFPLCSVQGALSLVLVRPKELAGAVDEDVGELGCRRCFGGEVGREALEGCGELDRGVRAEDV